MDVFDIVFAVVVIGGALLRFLTSRPGQRKERGCLLTAAIVGFILYFLLLPPDSSTTDMMQKQNQLFNPR